MIFQKFQNIFELCTFFTHKLFCLENSFFGTSPAVKSDDFQSIKTLESWKSISNFQLLVVSVVGAHRRRDRPYAR